MQSWPHDMPADKDEEVFEIVDDHNNVVGREQRGRCHKEGLCHRAAYCLVFNTKGQLLLQQRATKKKIGPNEWDLSLAEHLQPGETYTQAVVRGLKEELGIATELKDIEGPLAPCHQRTLTIPGLIKDVEFVASYRLNGWEGEIAMDADEVQACKWVDVAHIYQEIDHQPDLYTSWLRAELYMLRSELSMESDSQDWDNDTSNMLR